MKSINEHITDFLEYCEIEKGLSDQSIKNYAHFLKPFQDWLASSGRSTLAPQDLTPELVWDYRLHLSRARKLEKATQNYYLIGLRNLLSYFTEKNIPSIPADKIKLGRLQAKERKIKYLTLEQIEKLLLTPDIGKIQGLRDRAILETLFSTGLRVAELAALNRNQFPASKLKADKELELTITGKGGHIRTIYFSPRALEWIKKYLDARTDMAEALFVNHARNGESERLTIRSIEKMVKLCSYRAGIETIASPHTLRHSYATDLLTQGVDLRVVQEFLGHRNIVTTQIYTHVTKKYLKDIHEKFHSGKNLKD